MTYLIFDPEYQIKETSAGLMHQFTALACFYVYAKSHSLIPVLPKLILTGGHNNGNAKMLTDFIDIPDDFVEDVNKSDAYRIYKFDLGNTDDFLHAMRSHFSFKKEFKIIAEQVVSRIQKPFLCVRVRRGDMLYCNPLSVEASKIENIKQVLSRHQYKSVYIMTDEKDENYFNSIENKLQYFDFKELKDIKCNYTLFSIECCIQEMADIRISMFTIKHDPYYHGYLCDSYGIH